MSLSMSGVTDTTKRPVASAAKTTGRAVRNVFLGAFVLAYLTLWGGLAARHYAMGDLQQGLVTFGVFVVPFVGLVLYRAGQRYDTPDVAPEGTPSLS